MFAMISPVQGYTQWLFFHKLSQFHLHTLQTLIPAAPFLPSLLMSPFQRMHLSSQALQSHTPPLSPIPQGLSLTLHLSSTISITSPQMPPNVHWPLITVTLAESSPIEAPVIPHGHSSTSTSAKPETVASGSRGSEYWKPDSLSGSFYFAFWKKWMQQ